MLASENSHDLVVSVGGRKVSVSPDVEMANMLSGNLPPEAAALLASMQGQLHIHSTQDNQNSSPVLPPEAAQMLVMMSQASTAVSQQQMQSLQQPVTESVRPVLPQQVIPPIVAVSPPHVAPPVIEAIRPVLPQQIIPPMVAVSPPHVAPPVIEAVKSVLPQQVIPPVVAPVKSTLPPQVAPPIIVPVKSSKKESHTLPSHIELPPEATQMLEMMKQQADTSSNQQQQLSSQQSNSAVNSRIAISNTSPGLKYEVEKEITDKAISTTGHELVRSRPEEVQRAMDQQEAIEEIKNSEDAKDKFTIYETGVALEIIVGTSTRDQVVEIIKNYSKEENPEDNGLMTFYSDISITVFYNDDMIVRELQFGSNYKGKTSKGLQIGDLLEKAIEIYGPPRMKSPRGAIWNKFGVFCQYNMVSSIRVQM